jgi:hypothetical protein
MQRRGADGSFVSFGATPPSVSNLVLEIGASMRGEDRAAFDALTADQRAALGLAPGLSWDDCLTVTRPGADGQPVIFPNRTALEQALGFDYDLVHVFGAVPSTSDQQQMATGGAGYGGSGLTGQFLAGKCGMLFLGRWYLGQVRANAAFDWRLYRIPRWVPYREWARWQRAGMGPGQRDGEWGDREHPDRGYVVSTNTRCTFMSSSARNPAQAFSFLKFIATDADYNRLLLLEDGAGSDYALARDYLGKPDPLVPDEFARRPPEQELGAIRDQVPVACWPWSNYEERSQLDWINLPSWMGRDDLATTQPPGSAADDHPELAAYVHGVVATGGGVLRSQPAVGQALAEQYCGKIKDLAEAAIANDHPPAVAAPSGRTWLLLAVVAVAAGSGLVGLWRKGAHG